MYGSTSRPPRRARLCERATRFPGFPSRAAVVRWREFSDEFATAGGRIPCVAHSFVLAVADFRAASIASTLGVLVALPCMRRETDGFNSVSRFFVPPPRWKKDIYRFH